MKFLLSILLLFPLLVFGQVDHWESAVLDNDIWKYQVPTSEPNNWTTVGFDDSAWLSGNGGFGYGDNDDQTTIATTSSVYIRKVFNIVDVSAIASVIANVDYDDGYVAYLNGVEISRANVSGTPPTFSDFATGLHEADLYQGNTPSNILVGDFASILTNGNNVFAIQVHNESLTSSDLTARAFLSLGITDQSNNYSATPSWFAPPQPVSSYLPLVVLNTNGSSIVDDPKIMAEMGIIYNGENNLNNDTDPFNEFDGHIRIEIRGESSQSFPKKSYGFEMSDTQGNDIDTTFLNFPSEEDFILYAPYSDKTFLNNVLAMRIANAMGHYSSRTRLVELIINGEYLGVYVLMEKIKRDNNRVDIAKLTDLDLSGTDLTGGYIFRIDKGPEAGWNSNYDVYQQPGTKLWLQYFYPKPDIILPQQQTYLQQFVDSFETAIDAINFTHPNGKRYDEYIDVHSFIDSYILNEFTKDIDGYRLSQYFHKPKRGKIKAGPFWDFNLSLGNADYCAGWSPEGWEYDEACGNNPFWWENFLTDEVYTRQLKCRWENLRAGILHEDSLSNWVDSMHTLLSDPADRNYDRWQTLGTYVWPNPFPYPNSYDGVISNMKTWISGRLTWMDANILGTATDCQDWTINQVNTLKEKLRFTLTQPSNEVIKIVGPTIPNNLILMDLTGKVVSENRNTDQLNTGQLAPGVYVVNVVTQTQLTPLKFVKR